MHVDYDQKKIHCEINLTWLSANMDNAFGTINSQEQPDESTSSAPNKQISWSIWIKFIAYEFS